MPAKVERSHIATISDWKNNCAVAVMGDFVAEQLKSGHLRAAAVNELVRLVKSYYQIPLMTAADLIELLGPNYFVTPNHAQEILGCVFRDYLNDLTDMADQSGQLDKDAFQPVASLLEFGVRFYMEDKTENDPDESVIAFMPDLEINPHEGLKLDVVWHSSTNIKNPMANKKKDFHFDRIMQTPEAATLHDSFIEEQIQSFSRTGVSKYPQLERDNVEGMKDQIRTAVAKIVARKEEKRTDSPRSIVRETKSEHKETAVTQPFIVTPTRQRAPTPITFTSPVSPCEQKPNGPDVTSETKLSWKESISRNIVEKSIQTLEMDAASVELSQRRRNAPTQKFVMYTLWKNSESKDLYACVDTDTQVAWDAKMAEELQEIENAQSNTPRRP